MISDAFSEFGSVLEEGMHARLTLFPFGRPVEKCFPCLDLCRLAALHDHFAEVLPLTRSSVDVGGNKLLRSIAAKCVEGKNLVSGKSS